MQINYLGHSSFKIRGKNVTIITDPYDESVGFKFPKTKADIVTISHSHADHNFIKKLSPNAFVISAPGEYEIKDAFIIGVSSFHDTSSGSQRGRNTCYVYEVDNLRLCHLGDLGHKLDKDQLDEITNIDILMIPTGGVYTIGPKMAVEVISQIQPSIIIPMHYKTKEHNPEIFGKLALVDEFLKQAEETPKRLPRLVINSQTLPEEQEVVVLKPKHA